MDDFVGLLAVHAFLDEGEEDALGEGEAVAGLEVFAHAFGVDLKTADDEGEEVEHVVEEGAGVREDDPLDGGVRDVALVPEGDILEGGDGVAAEEAGEAGDALALLGVAFVGHRR